MLHDLTFLPVIYQNEIGSGSLPHQSTLGENWTCKTVQPVQSHDTHRHHTGERMGHDQPHDDLRGERPSCHETS